MGYGNSKAIHSVSEGGIRMTKNEVQINFSNLSKDIPYTFILKRWQNGKRYNTFFVLFDAAFEFWHGERSFKLCLPIQPVLNAIKTLPMNVKRADSVRLTFIKRDMGEIEITNVEVVK